MHNAKVAIIRFPAIPSKLLKSYSPISNVGGTNIILFLGRVTWRKGIHILIKAFANVHKVYSDTKLIIAGPYDLYYKRYLDSLVGKLNLMQVVKFIGPIYGNAKIKLIRGSKVFVLPSLKEYTPCILLETQALEVPVIASKVGAISEMMIDRQTGLLVEPGNEQKLAEAIKLLLGNEELRRRFSAKAKEFARNFTVNKAVDELEEIYYGLIKSN